MGSVVGKAKMCYGRKKGKGPWQRIIVIIKLKFFLGKEKMKKIEWLNLVFFSFLFKYDFVDIY